MSNYEYWMFNDIPIENVMKSNYDKEKGIITLNCYTEGDNENDPRYIIKAWQEYEAISESRTTGVGGKVVLQTNRSKTYVLTNAIQNFRSVLSKVSFTEDENSDRLIFFDLEFTVGDIIYIDKYGKRYLPRETTAIKITDGFYREEEYEGERVYLGTFTFNYDGHSPLVLASTSNADLESDRIFIDDYLELIVNGNLYKVIPENPGVITYVPPINVTSLFRQGVNTIQATIVSQAPVQIGCSSLWFIQGAYPNLSYKEYLDQSNTYGVLGVNMGEVKITEEHPITRVDIYGGASELPGWVEVNGIRKYWHYARDQQIEKLIFDVDRVQQVTIKSPNYLNPPNNFKYHKTMITAICTFYNENVSILERFIEGM